MNLNVSPPSHLPIDQIQEDHHLYPFGMDPSMISSSPSSVLCRDFFNTTHDRTDYYHHKLYQSQLRHGDQTYAYNQGSGSTVYEFKNKVENSGLKLTLWKKESDTHHQGVVEKDNTQGKWMSSKTNDRVVIKIKTKFDDHCLQSSSSLGSDGSSNSSSIINNSLIRVCADCKTTKTPLWRSGPQGPKSLCNACGIRQRKARRAMAAATICNSATIAANEAPPSMKIKLPQKEKHTRINERHDLPVKKRGRFVVESSQNKRSDLEDFLIKLSKSINFRSVFPEDEKDAAILLMALSSGLVHG